jgi:hypothetical protein
MIQETVLNNISVKPLVNGNAIDEKKIKGSALFPTLYDCVYLCSRRRSGKTSVLAEILKKTSDRKTTFWLFVPTSRVDESWKTIISLLESRGNTVNVFDSIMEGKTNLLDEIVADLSVGDEPPKKEQPQSIQGSGVKLMFEPKESEKKKYEYKPKKMAPEHIFVFDDISQELKNTALTALTKKSRHLKATVYISSQYLNDCTPQVLKQLSYFICFRSMTRDKLDHIHKMLDLSIDVDKFYDIYDFATKEPFSFLYCDMKNQSFRKNFNRELKYDE